MWATVQRKGKKEAKKERRHVGREEKGREEWKGSVIYYCISIRCQGEDRRPENLKSIKITPSKF